MRSHASLGDMQLGSADRSVSGTYGTTVNKLYPNGWCFAQGICPVPDQMKYYFAVMDKESAMSRVEASKVSARDMD